MFYFLGHLYINLLYLNYLRIIYIYIYSPKSNKEATRLRVDIVVWRKKIMNPKSVVWENFQGLEALLCFQGILDFTVNNFYPF